MRVKAKELGYYEHSLRKEGDVFILLNEKSFSPRWMEKLDVAVAPAAAPAQSAPRAKASKKAKAGDSDLSSGDTEVI